MSFLRVMNMFLFVVAVVLTGCEDGVVPEELRTPSLPSVGAAVDGRVVTLTATFKSERDLSSAKEFGFYFGKDEQSLERMTAPKADGLGYSLIRDDLDYSTTYLYKAWVGNGRDEVLSDLLKVVTSEEPVGPDPPSPVERNIEFKDPVVKALCVENWDLDGDGELSKAEAAKVTNLRWVFKRNNEITSFEELEYFTGLRSVADSAFKCSANLRSVKLPESVTVIGDHTFEECENLTLPKLPDNLTTVGEAAFCFCEKLSLNSLPETLTNIGNWAFSCCTNLALTRLPSGLTSIGDGTFNRCFSIVPEELPSGLTRLGSWAFSECSFFNPISFPEGVKSIGNYAFGGCHSLTWDQLPSTLNSMGAYAFSQCNKVRFSSIPEGVTRINKATFEGCFSMRSIILPESLQVIDSLAFNGLPLTDVTIPENVTFIGRDAFKGSGRLMPVIMLPKTPPVIEDTYLGDNADLIYVHAESLNQYKTAENWTKWKDKLFVVPEELIPRRIIEFKDPVVKALCVENWDRDGDGELSKEEASKVTNLQWVFKRNEEITSFEEMEYFTGLRSVADSAFKCCVNLRSVKLPEKVRSIEGFAFHECENVLISKLPENLKSIGEFAFDHCSCLTLTKLPDNLTDIGSHAFRLCTRLALTELPEKLTNIAWFAFAQCTNLALTKLPSGMTRIEGGVFAGCTSLSLEYLPSGLTYIGPYAFTECTSFNIESLRLPAGLEYFGEWAFNCCRFSEISIPEKVEFIGACAFCSCSMLRKVTVLPVTPPEMEDTFLGDNADEIFVPSASLEKYKTAKNWSEWKTKYKLLTENSGQAL